MRPEKTKDKKKKKKRDQSIIEKEMMAIIQASLNECVKKAMDEILGNGTLQS